MKKSKRYSDLKKQVNKEYVIEDLKEAVAKVKQLATAKFDETVELAANLNVNPKYADQIVRGTVVLPHGTGKTVRVLVIAEGDKAEEAKNAGADHVGSDDYVEKIQGGWLDIDTIIATPDMMRKIGKLGRVLGPRGLMPNPKTGTVTQDIAKAVKEVKAGKIEYRTDKHGNIHAPIGKASFPEEKLRDNAVVFMNAIIKDRPAPVKGQYVLSVTLAPTMGPGVRISPQVFINASMKGR